MWSYKYACAIAIATVAWAAPVLGEIIRIDTTLYQPDPPYTFHQVDDGENPPTTLTILDGAMVDGSVKALGSSIVNMYGGDIRTIGAAAYSVVNIHGGEIGKDEGLLAVGHWGVLNFVGGTAYGNALVQNEAAANLLGGAILGDLTGIQQGVTNLLDGSIEGNVTLLSSSRLNMLGGRIGSNLLAEDETIVNLHGGSIAGEISAVGSATIHVWGYDLDLTDNLLTGTLADGTPLNHEALTGDNGQIFLHQIPEPAVLLTLLSAALAGLLIIRRARAPSATALPAGQSGRARRCRRRW
jgi:hypothetical protein